MNPSLIFYLPSPQNPYLEESDVNMIFKFSWIIAITTEIEMGGKLRKTMTDAVAEILVTPCSRGGLWRGEETRGIIKEIEPVSRTRLLLSAQSEVI